MDGAYREGKGLRDFVEFIVFLIGVITLPFVIGFFILVILSSARGKRFFRYIDEYESAPGIGD